MFNFSTTTIINSDKDFMSDKALFSSIAASGTRGAILKVKRDFHFEMPYITKVYKRKAKVAEPAEMQIDCTALLACLPAAPIYPISGRISIYVSLEGSEESSFANDFYQKGLPFSIGFFVKDASVTAADLATQIAKNVKKFNVATVGRKLFEVTAAGTNVTFKCTDEYLRFKSIIILNDLGDREEEMVHLLDGEQGNPQTVISIVNRGVNGFGTFRHLMKDLRLPTSLNTNWTGIHMSERPSPGALYDQYLIYYKAPSGTNPSLAAVGHETESKTTHSFWVRRDFSASFEAVITATVGSGPGSNPTDIFEEV